MGKYADVAVWDRDLYAASAGAIKDLKCQMTLFGGRIVYRADGAPIRVSESLGGKPRPAAGKPRS